MATVKSIVSVSLDRDLVEQLDRIAGAIGVSRSTMAAIIFKKSLTEIQTGQHCLYQIPAKESAGHE